jgi:hypothetical protein
MSDELNQRIAAEFAAARRNQNIAGWILGLVILAVCLFTESRPGGWFVLLMVASVVGFFLFSLYNWRCPSCDEPLWGRKASIGLSNQSKPLFCPYCGERLA